MDQKVMADEQDAFWIAVQMEVVLLQLQME